MQFSVENFLSHFIISPKMVVYHKGFLNINTFKKVASFHRNTPFDLFCVHKIGRQTLTVVLSLVMCKITTDQLRTFLWLLVNLFLNGRVGRILHVHWLLSFSLLTYDAVKQSISWLSHKAELVCWCWRCTRNQKYLCSMWTTIRKLWQQFAGVGRTVQHLLNSPVYVSLHVDESIDEILNIKR